MCRTATPAAPAGRRNSSTQCRKTSPHPLLTTSQSYAHAARLGRRHALQYKTATPAAPAAPANSSACRRDTRPVGSGRRIVRFISASLATSYTWFSVLAAAAQPNVPSAVQASPPQSISSPLPGATQKRKSVPGYESVIRHR